MKERNIEVTVNSQSQYFHLAFEREGVPNWQRKAGHEISVGPYRFCAIPMNGCINISEVTTGYKFQEIDLNPVIMALTTTKEDTLVFFESVVGPSLKRQIECLKNFDENLAKMQRKTFERFGEMPPNVDIDVDALIAASVEEVVEKGV